MTEKAIRISKGQFGKHSLSGLMFDPRKCVKMSVECLIDSGGPLVKGRTYMIVVSKHIPIMNPENLEVINDPLRYSGSPIKEVSRYLNSTVARFGSFMWFETEEGGFYYWGGFARDIWKIREKSRHVIVEKRGCL